MTKQLNRITEAVIGAAMESIESSVPVCIYYYSCLFESGTDYFLRVRLRFKLFDIVKAKHMQQEANSQVLTS